MSSFVSLLILAYLLGSIPSGKLVGYFKGIDIQKAGSGNIGFANVRRTLGWWAGLAVLATDLLKGYAPTLVATNHLSVKQCSAVALAAVVGHIFPFWLKFKGGKGVATGMGAALALDPLVGLIGGAAYLAGVWLFRISAVGSLLAVAVLLVSAIFISDYVWFYPPFALLVVLTHRQNLKQLRERRRERS